MKKQARKQKVQTQNQAQKTQLTDDFSLEEFFKEEYQSDLSYKIIADIITYHTNPLQAVRSEFGLAIIISEQSCFRPRWAELQNGRSGNSEHTFKEDREDGTGAVDITFDDFFYNYKRIVDLLLEHTEYTQICVYKDKCFIHCDYNTQSKTKNVFECKDGGSWVFKYSVLGLI